MKDIAIAGTKTYASSVTHYCVPWAHMHVVFTNIQGMYYKGLFLVPTPA